MHSDCDSHVHDQLAVCICLLYAICACMYLLYAICSCMYLLYAICAFEHSLDAQDSSVGHGLLGHQPTHPSQAGVSYLFRYPP